MSVLWLILKIVLYLFLALLGIVILLLIGLLFLPITYDIDYSKEEESFFNVHIKAFVFVRIFFKGNSEENLLTVKVLGKTLRKRPLTEEEVVEDVEKTKEGVLESAQDVAKKPHGGTFREEPKKSEIPQNPTLKQDQINKKKMSAKSDKEISKKEDKESKSSWTAYLKAIKDAWQDPDRKVFLSAFWKLLKKWFSAIKPSYCSFHLIIGKEDPGETGQLIAKLTMAYPWYCPYGMISGNYTEAGIWGNVKIAGEFALKSLITPLIAFVWQKRVREYIYTLLKFRKEDKNGI